MPNNSNSGRVSLPPNEVSVEAYAWVKNDYGPTVASRLLYSWLSDDTGRARLYKDMVEKECFLKFESRALVDARAPSGQWQGLDEDRPKTYRQDAYLVVHPDHVEQAYAQASTVDPGQENWSHTPYSALGGTFMLALDEPNSGTDHFQNPKAQRKYCYDLLEDLKPAYDAIATVAFKAGAALALKGRVFDLADLAEMVAINYVARLFGFSQADLPMLKSTAQKIGTGLMYVNVGQHFQTDASALVQAKQALAQVSHRAAELIDLYDCPVGKEQEDAWDDLQEEIKQLCDTWFEEPDSPKAAKVQLLQTIRTNDENNRKEPFRPLMQLMSRAPRANAPSFSTTEKAIMVAGLVSGTITNLRAAVCIAVNQFLELTDDLKTVRDKAVDAWLLHRDASWSDRNQTAQKFRALVEEALRVNPPPPFVPRRAAKEIQLSNHQTIPKDSLIVIAVGGGSWKPGGFSMDAIPSVSESYPTRVSKATKPSGCPFSKVFGGRPETVRDDDDRAEYMHSCIGKDMAMYSVTYTVRQIMLLPGLTQSLDDQTGKPKGLTKRAGFICEKYPLEYEREKVLRQSPLQTILQVKNPVPEHAAALRQVLQFGAPFIEKVLREARHVHFASFMFLDNDSKLVLFTAYDGDFDAYIGHFAREFGPLFDRFFSHIENGPPAPIADHAFEFVQFLRRFQQPAVGGLFFSAYPEAQADQIAWHFNKNRKFDFLTLEGSK
jgi:cytochrome P450